MTSYKLTTFAIIFAVSVLAALTINGWILQHVLELHLQTLACPGQPATCPGDNP